MEPSISTEAAVARTRPSIAPHDRVPASQKVYLGFASTGANMLGTIVGSAILTYYLDVLHLRPTYIGTVYLLYGIWNAINDPLFGYWSDRRPVILGKGKRLFFLKLGIPIYLAGYALFWLPTPAWGQAALFINLFAALFLFDTALTMYLLNHNALQAGMTADPNERASISLWGTLIAVLPIALVRFMPPYLLTGTIERWMIIGSFLAVAAVGTILMVFGVRRIRENVSLYAHETPLGIWESLKASLSSRAFLCFVIYSFAMGGVALAFTSISIPYLKYVFHLEGMQAMLPVIIAGVIQIALYPVIYRINQFIGLRATLLMFVLVSILGYAGLYFVTHFGWMIFFFGCTQWGAACHWLLLNAIVGDIADEDELKTGQRREGAFFGINALIVAPAQSIIFAVFTWIIEAYGYTAAFGKTPDPSRAPEAIMGIRLGAALVPCLFLIVGIITLYLYPLKGARYTAMKQAVAELHRRKISTTEAA